MFAMVQSLFFAIAASKRSVRETKIAKSEICEQKIEMIFRNDKKVHKSRHESGTNASRSTTNTAMQSSWDIFLHSLKLKSRQQYLNRVDHYQKWSVEHPDLPFRNKMLQYAAVLHEGLAATTIWSQMSIIKRYEQLGPDHHNCNTEVPELTSLMKQWSKNESVKQAKVFTAEDWGRFFGDENSRDNSWLHRSAIMAVSLSGLLRVSEVSDLKFEQVKLHETIEGTLIEISGLQRKKKAGPEASSSFFIKDVAFVAAFQRYISKFPNEVCFSLLIVFLTGGWY
jgi:hypothetical protein